MLYWSYTIGYSDGERYRAVGSWKRSNFHLGNGCNNIIQTTLCVIPENAKNLGGGDYTTYKSGANIFLPFSLSLSIYLFFFHHFLHDNVHITVVLYAGGRLLCCVYYIYHSRRRRNGKGPPRLASSPFSTKPTGINGR